MPGAQELLEALHTRYELYLATNGTPEVQNSRIESAGIARYFQNIFISEQMGAYKPSRPSSTPALRRSRTLMRRRP